MNLKETDLYEPVKLFLEQEGFSVQAEVKDCDIAAWKEGQLILVELKKSFNLKLVYQAIERQGLTELVYIAIPRPEKSQRERAWKDMLRLCKRSELGVLTVALDSPLQTVDVILEPSDSVAWKNRKKRQRLEQEMAGRALNVNQGGMTRRKIMTAYRERALALCCFMAEKDGVSTKELREMGVEAKSIGLLQKNPNHWYERVEKGVYRLSEAGREALLDPDYEAVVAYYKEKGGFL